MKKFLLFMTAAIAAMSLSAAPVDQATAARKAKSYLTDNFYAGQLMAPAALNPVLLKAEMGNAKINQPVYYIFNTSTTFLVVAGDDRAEEILMVGDRPLKDINNLAPGLQDVLGQYKEQITYLQEHPGLQVDPVIKSNETPSLRASSYLMTALWDQEAPYWNLCKFTRNGTTYQCLTGCPATSASMVMYYWKYPTTQVAAMPSYTGTLELSYYSSYTFTYPSLDATTFDWANMKDSYSGSYTTAQGNAVATLMRYVGQGEQMMYGTESAGGSGIYTTDTQNIVDMFTTFGYDASTCRVVQKSSYSESSWASLIQAEMAAGRPIVFMAVSTSGGGHAFNVDGYDSSSNKYHVNFGWSGDGNSWYSMNSFSYSGYTFNSGQQAVIGIQPPSGSTTTPVLTVNPTSLSFTGCSTGETYTKTFTVSATDLRGDVSISSNSGTFAVSPTTLTAAQAQAGATITVTYKPTSAGTQTGTITVSSSAAESKTVSVSGTATTTPKITANPTSLSLSTTVGTPVTQTFTVTGTNLTGGVYLSCSGTGFSIDKTNITRTAAGSGATVTVTYNPSDVGTHTGTVTLTSTGAETVTVALNGTAVGTPTIVANPTTLSFNTVVGTPVTKTFTVTGTDLTGTVYLGVTGTGFSIDKTSITRNAATNGATVTVTYNPTTGGSSTGIVTVTSTGAQTVNVSLNGIATTVPTITANPTSLDFQTTVGTPVTKSFVLNAANLEGDVQLAVEGEGFTIDKTSIIPGAANNAYVNVTYTPTAFGMHSGTVTITSTNCQPVTVALNGQADLVKYAPVMLPADEAYINLTKFRADWTDQTPAENVASYTLEVGTKPVVPEVELLSSIAGTDFTGSSTGYYNITLPAPWDGTNVRGGLNSIIYFRNNYNNDGSYGNITYTIPAGYENATFTMKITTANTNDAVGNLAVETPQTASVNHYFNKNTTYAWVVTASSGDKITITTPDAQYSPDIALMEVYSGDASTVALKANETGDETYRLITGITDRFYTVENLTAEGTFLYKVKAIYLDGTESEWSNIEEVTLFENGHGFEPGDVDHDGKVNIDDVTALIDYLLGSDTGVCTICADVDDNGKINIDDVTTLIDMLLGGGTASFNNPAAEHIQAIEMRESTTGR
ncbi:MAG: C10 family peptidase [Muribaculaceae bacterium]|nr:C10 family peptidase [Muribaculaceae bacterium]